MFDLYGPQVEPCTDEKQRAVKAAVVQAAGHGVTLEQVSISVIGTYRDQERQVRCSHKIPHSAAAVAGDGAAAI